MVENKKREKTGGRRWPAEQMEQVITIPGHHDILFPSSLQRKQFINYIKKNPVLMSNLFGVTLKDSEA